MEEVPRHRCLVYDGSPSVLLPGISAIIAERLQSNYRCLYLNSPPMIAGLRSYLSAIGVDPAQAVARGSLILVSDQAHLVNGDFDSRQMLSNLNSAVNSALLDGYKGLWASGDMLWEFGSEKNLGKLLRYELDLEELILAQPALCGICQYHRDVLPPTATKVALFAHRGVYLNGTLSRLNPHYQDLATLRSGSRHALSHIDEMLDGLLQKQPTPIPTT